MHKIGPEFHGESRKLYPRFQNRHPAANSQWRTTASASRTNSRRQHLLKSQETEILTPSQLAPVTPSQGFSDRYNRHNRNPENNPKQRLSLLGRFALDLALITLSFIIAYFIRYGLQLGKEVFEENQVPVSQYFSSMVGFILIFFIMLQVKGFYRPGRNVTYIDEIGIIASAAAYTVLIELAMVFITRPIAVSRLMYLYLFPVSVILLGLERGITRYTRKELLKRGIGVRNLLVIGATDPATRIMQAIIETPSLGLKLVGYVDDELRFSEWTLPLRYRSGEQVPLLGDINQLPEFISRYKVEEIILALPANMHEAINDVINLCHEEEIAFTLVPDLFELQVNALDLKELNGIPVIGVKDNRLTGWNYFVKRLIDIGLALAFLTVAAIPMLIIAIAIKLDSDGPIILRQTRIGKYGKAFTFYKFRSMVPNADAILEELKKYNQTGGATFKMVDDPRLTKVGRLIRRTSLDELPQIFNILLGQMSFVGPRPGLEREVKQYQDWHFRRLEVTPGLTGLWQVSGRSKLKFDEMVRLDIYYAENWSVWLDLKILLRTIPAVLKREGAY
ncbi:MAG TPA: sugar transferase [Chloroflexia bacterium]|nr:sugar transferase [Chloroflexia bacterium]